ncbi:MAG: hypothetical protein ACJ796_23465 [Gemmatimonadaceae bacterium]
MTVQDWIVSRTPAPPAALASRILQSLGNDAGLDATLSERACLDAAVELLQGLLARDPLGRDGAADLLAADALVTYAFEAAATEKQLDHRAAEAMRRLAALATPGAPSAA